MEDWIPILLPFALILARVSGFFAVAPVLSWAHVPVRVRAALALMVTIFFALITPRSALAVSQTKILWVVVLMLQEVLCGAAVGLAVRLVFTGVQQGGRIAGRQMGMMMASVMDPTTGERSQPMGVLFDMAFTVLFLAAGGHHMVLRLLADSYRVFPAATTPDVGAMLEGIVVAGSTMLLFALKMAAPILAAYLVLGVMLAVLARVLPEMNILTASLPLRVAIGLFMAISILPMLNSFTVEMGDWIQEWMMA